MIGGDYNFKRFTNKSFRDLGGSYSNPEDAIAAYENARNNPILGTWSTTGHSVTGLGQGGVGAGHGYINIDGSWTWSDGVLVGAGSYVGIGAIRTTPGYYLGDINIAEQPQRPENPGLRTVAVSTYGNSIPVSTGRRLVAANIVDADTITPRIVGTYDYWVEYKIPVYQTGPQ